MNVGQIKIRLLLINLLFVLLIPPRFFAQKCLTSEENLKKEEILAQYNWIFLSYLGGSANDEFTSIVLKDSSIYIGGLTSGPNFPYATNLYGNRRFADFVIIKMNLQGKVIWGTIVASSGDDYLFAIALDSNGNVWCCGETNGFDFFTTPNAIQKNFRGGTADGVIFQLDSQTGKLLFSTFLGGTNYDSFTHLVVNKDNTIWLTGRTSSGDFPLTPNAEKNVLLEEYNTPIVQISTNGALLYSSFFGGSTGGSWVLGDVIDVLSSGDIVIAGYTNSNTLPISPNAYQKTKSQSFDSFNSIFDSNGKLKYCTYFGGNSADYASQITIDQDDNIYILHYTRSSDLTLLNSTLNSSFSGATDIFLSVFDKNGIYLFGSYFGGVNFEGFDYGGLNYIGGSVRLTQRKNIALLFRTNSTNLPTDLHVYSKDFDSYLLILNNKFERIFSTYVGGNNFDTPGDLIPIDDTTFALCGLTSSNDLPLKYPIQSNLGGSYDGFVGILRISQGTVDIIDTLPPTYTSITDSCGAVKIISIADTQSTISGIESINPIRLDNVGFNIVSKTKTSAKIVVQLLDKNKTGYYKIEVTDKSNNKLILEDSLYANFSDLLRFNPSDSFDFGKRNFFSTSCEKIWLCNKTTDTIILKTLALKQNIDFSIPPSELPIVLPPLDSTQIAICFAPVHEQTSIYKDTLEIVDECFYKRIVFKAKIDTNYYFASSRCNTKVYGTSNFTAFVDKLVVERISSNQLLVRLNQTDNNSIEIEIFDILGRNIYKGNFPNGNALIDFPFEKNSMYLIRIYASGGFSQLIFFTFD